MYFLLKMGIIHCYVSLPEGTKTQSRTPIRFPWKIRCHLGLHSGWLRSSPSLKGLPHNFGLPRKTSDFAMLGEKSVKCMHPKTRCSQNPQKWFILLWNDSDFRFSNLQSGFGRAWINPCNNILCFKNITFAQPSLHEKNGHVLWSFVSCLTSQAKHPRLVFFHVTDIHPLVAQTAPFQAWTCCKSFVKRCFFLPGIRSLDGGPIWPTNWYGGLSQSFAGVLPSFQ